MFPSDNHLITLLQSTETNNPLRRVCLFMLCCLIGFSHLPWTEQAQTFGSIPTGSWLVDLIAMSKPYQRTTAFETDYPPQTNMQPDVVSHGTAFPRPSVGSSESRYGLRKTKPMAPNSRYPVSVRQNEPMPALMGRKTASNSRGSDNHSNFNTHANQPQHSIPVAVPDGGIQHLFDQELAVCHSLTGLTTHQRRICLQHAGLVWAMLDGTQLGMHECVHQFRHERWNCSAVNLLYPLWASESFTGVEQPAQAAASGLEGILQRGSRETAFLSSAWSAGVVQAITRACSRGQMGTCDCDPHRRELQDRDTEGIFTWGGCSDPIRFAMRLARQFLDAQDREHRDAAIVREQELHGPRPSARPHRQRRIPPKFTPENNGFYPSSNAWRPKREARDRSATTQNMTKTVERGGPSVSGVKNLTTGEVSTAPHGLSPKELRAETLRIIQTKARTLMNLHNRRAGRRLIWKHRVRKCKCHGVSGACSMRTCWQRVNDFRHVGARLKTAYDDAVRVTYEPRRDVLRPIAPSPVQTNYLHTPPMGLFSTYSRSRTPMVGGNRYGTVNRRPDSRVWTGQRRNWLLSPSKKNEKEEENSQWSRQRWPRDTAGSANRVVKSKLVYMEESPNYCRFDSTIGHLGIAGRLCNASTTNQANSCNRICCDQGWETLEYDSERKCDCKFVWCCEVRCKICREHIVENRCKN